MPAVRAVDVPGGVAGRSLAERSKIRRELGRLDTIFFLISAVVVGRHHRGHRHRRRRRSR